MAVATGYAIAAGARKKMLGRQDGVDPSPDGCRWRWQIFTSVASTHFTIWRCGSWWGKIHDAIHPDLQQP